MAEITMPRLSDTMQEGTISSWLKKPGDSVDRGEVIAQIETDKATMDLTAFEAGTLQEILAPEGTTVPIGQTVARIGSGAPATSRKAAQPSSDASQPDAASPASDASAPDAPSPVSEPDASAQSPVTATDGEAAEPRKPASGEEPSADAPVATAEKAASPPPDGAVPDKVRASPVARHIAAERGLDLHSIRGSGPRGRVIRADVEAALAGPPPAEAPSAKEAPPDNGDERVRMSQMRRTIARRMAESTSTVPHFFLTVAVDATELVRLREQIVEQTADEGVKVSLNDLVIKAVALAARRQPDVNVSFDGDSLIRHAHVNVGVAVATDRGLIVPVVRDADQKSVSQIASEVRDLGARSREGKLQPPEYSGGTITVSNLGMFGVEQFNAVINPPEAAIVAVGAVSREPAEHQGQIALRERMRITLSVDHRALDGAAGARYLQALKGLLERPLVLLI